MDNKKDSIFLQVTRGLERMDEDSLHGISPDDLFLVTEALMDIKSDIQNEVYSSKTVNQVNKILRIQEKYKKPKCNFLNNTSILNKRMFSDN